MSATATPAMEPPRKSPASLSRADTIGAAAAAAGGAAAWEGVADNVDDVVVKNVADVVAENVGVDVAVPVADTVKLAVAVGLHDGDGVGGSASGHAFALRALIT